MHFKTDLGGIDSVVWKDYYEDQQLSNPTKDVRMDVMWPMSIKTLYKWYDNITWYYYCYQLLFCNWFSCHLEC